MPNARQYIKNKPPFAMPSAVNVALAIILIISSAIWLGGYRTLRMVSIISARTLNADARVQFFKRFGRAYFVMAGSALAKGVLFRARLAAGLRALIGVFSLGIVVQVALLLSAS